MRCAMYSNSDYCFLFATWYDSHEIINIKPRCHTSVSFVSHFDLSSRTHFELYVNTNWQFFKSGQIKHFAIVNIIYELGNWEILTSPGGRLGITNSTNKNFLINFVCTVCPHNTQEKKIPFWKDKLCNNNNNKHFL